jgi:hypothetical protein
MNGYFWKGKIYTDIWSDAERWVGRGEVGWGRVLLAC